MMAELFGKKTGYNKGKGGSMHIAARSLASWVQRRGRRGAYPSPAGRPSRPSCGNRGRSICFMGDGATNTGRFHEGVNLAPALNLPMVYVIENNGYAISIRFSDSAR